MLFGQQCDIALSLTLAAPISKCFRRPWFYKHTDFSVTLSGAEPFYPS